MDIADRRAAGLPALDEGDFVEANAGSAARNPGDTSARDRSGDSAAVDRRFGVASSVTDEEGWAEVALIDEATERVRPVPWNFWEDFAPPVFDRIKDVLNASPRMPQCYPAFLAIAPAAVIGTTVGLRVRSEAKVLATGDYLAICGPSGTEKTGAIRAMAQDPARAFEKHYRKMADDLARSQGHGDAAIAIKVLKSKIESAAKSRKTASDEDKADIEKAQELLSQLRWLRRDLFATDATPAALIDEMAEGRGAAVIISDEAADFLHTALGLRFGKPGAGADLSAINNPWDGTPVRQRRRGHGRIGIDDARTTFVLGGDEELLSKLESADDAVARRGATARFLVLAKGRESIQPPRRGCALDRDTEARFLRFWVGALRLVEAFVGDNPRENTLVLTPEAAKRVFGFRTELHERVATLGLEDRREIAEKAGLHVVRVAAQLHIAQHGAHPSLPGAVDISAVEAAAALVTAALSHVDRALAACSSALTTEARALAVWLRKNERRNSILKGELRRFGPRRLRRKEAFYPAIENLLALDFLRVDEGRLRGTKWNDEQAKVTFEINPHLWEAELPEDAP